MKPLISELSNPIITVLVAGLISLLGLIISKEQKTSEFRQAWIDSLRLDVAAVVAHANAIFNRISLFKGLEPKIEALSDMWKDVRADVIEINSAMSRIRLRLNKKERASSAILDILGGFETIFGADQASLLNFKTVNDLSTKLVEQTNVVLKQEWVRVRRGETAYRLMLYGAASVVSLSFVMLLIYLFDELRR